MTIKQQGGIFGRNPTFNNVSVEDLNVSTSASFQSIVEISRTTPIIHLMETDTSDVNTRIRNAGGNYQISTANDALNSFTARMNISHTTGDIILYKDNGSTAGVTFDASSGNLAFASGSGIDFSATSGTGTSELFDDYEEGDFTVQFADAVSGGNSVNGGYGHYTKVGNLVTVSFAIVNINTSGLTGGNPLYFRGLPYTARTVSGPGIFVGSVNTSNVTSTGQPTACLPESGTWGYFRDTAGNILVSDVSSGAGDIYVSLTYEAV